MVPQYFQCCQYLVNIGVPRSHLRLNEWSQALLFGKMKAFLKNVSCCHICQHFMNMCKYFINICKCMVLRTQYIDYYWTSLR